MKICMEPGNLAIRVRAALAWGCALLVLGSVTGCATGPENVHVHLAPYASQPARHEGMAPTAGLVRIDRVRDARHDEVGGLVGDRTGLGGMSMGKIEVLPEPTAMVATLLQAELTAMGLKVVESDEQFRVDARLLRFRISTPATALYWDINGVIELELDVQTAGGTGHMARYTANCTERTYAWPSEEIIGRVVSACLKEGGRQLRGDARLSEFLSAR